LVSGGTDGKVIIYKWIPGTSVEVIDTIQFKAVYPLSLSLHQLPTNKGEETLILAIGATDTKIHLHTFAPAKDTKFAQVLKLNGHEDWVRSLQFTTLDNLQVILASGGQDRYIRLWRIEQLNDQLIEQK
jgi:elongator complex protein 2